IQALDSSDDHRVRTSAAAGSLDDAADDGFVDLDLALKLRPPFTNHCPAKLVQRSPCSLVAGDPHQTHEVFRRQAELLRDDEAHRFEPPAQRLASPVQNRSRGERCLPGAARALEKVAACELPAPPASTSGATEAVGP